MGKIKFEGSPPYTLPLVQSVTARPGADMVDVTLEIIAPGKEPSLIPIKIPMMLDSAQNLKAQLDSAIRMSEVRQRR